MISKCRICGSNGLSTHVDFGDISLSGVFPNPNQHVSSCSLALSKCNTCGLVQLRDTMKIDNFYGKGYGYESHLNGSMKNHLQNSARQLEKIQNLSSGDVVLDIASNDGTLLSGYKKDSLKVGIDPSLEYVSDYYPKNCLKATNFFNAQTFLSLTSKRAKIITSFAVFYDLDDPYDFVHNIKLILAYDGIWVLEQSYLPSMIKSLSFDTICHEHILYLTLTDIDTLCKKGGLEIFDVQFNDINGGSFQVFIQHINGPRKISPYVAWVIKWEKSLFSITSTGLDNFNKRILNFSDKLNDLILSYRKSGYQIWGLGASTKGNILLQVCGLDNKLIEAIGEINFKKFGKVTPGSNIPIINEVEITNNGPWLGLVLPWHFKDSIISKSTKNFMRNCTLMFPLPNWPEIVNL